MAKSKEEIKADKFWAGIDERKAAIEAKLRCEVFPITVLDTDKAGELVVGFARKPDLTTLLRLIDKSAGNPDGYSVEACSIALDSLLIVSETDPRIADKKDTRYWIAASVCLSQFMMTAIPVIKKK